MDEKMRILKMLEEGKITAEDAAGLLAAFEEPAGTEIAVRPNGYENRMLRIYVDDNDGDKVRVNFPVRLAKKILNATGRLPVNVEGMEGMDMSELMTTIGECLDDETLGELVTVDGKDGEKIRIVIE